MHNVSVIICNNYFHYKLDLVLGEANKIINDYKYRMQKSEQEIASLQASLARSETQVIRYKSTAEAAEKAETELKVERRKLQREVRRADMMQTRLILIIGTRKNMIVNYVKNTHFEENNQKLSSKGAIKLISIIYEVIVKIYEMIKYLYIIIS